MKREGGRGGKEAIPHIWFSSCPTYNRGRMGGLIEKKNGGRKRREMPATTIKIVERVKEGT